MDLSSSVGVVLEVSYAPSPIVADRDEAFAVYAVALKNGFQLLRDDVLDVRCLSLGGVFKLADIGVRILPTASELKLGVVAAIIGAPAFIWIAVQRRVISD